MKTLLLFFISVLSATVGSMGFGGGSVLLLILTVFFDTNQLKAQGINLLFFIPVALVATIINTIKGKIDFDTVLPLCLGGMLGSPLGIFIAEKIGKTTLSHIVGIGIILLSVKELFFVFKTILERLKRG